MKTLVLDKTYRPIKLVDWQEAFMLFFKEKADVLEYYADKIVRSVSKSWKVPAVIRVKDYIEKKFKVAKYSRKNVFLRDQGFCQYCAENLKGKPWTIDHVFPSSRGGRSEWSNVVVSCKTCNQAKGDRTPEEAKMKLLQKPVAPFGLSKDHYKESNPLWEAYLW